MPRVYVPCTSFSVKSSPASLVNANQESLSHENGPQPGERLESYLKQELPLKHPSSASQERQRQAKAQLRSSKDQVLGPAPPGLMISLTRRVSRKRLLEVLPLKVHGL